MLDTEGLVFEWLCHNTQEQDSLQMKNIHLKFWRQERTLLPTYNVGICWQRNWGYTVINWDPKEYWLGSSLPHQNGGFEKGWQGMWGPLF